MRALLLCASLLGACESRDDFPAAPGPITWTDMPLVPRDGSVDGTSFQISVPASAQPHVMGSFETAFDYSDLSVRITVYQEAVAVEDVVVDGTYFESTPIENLTNTLTEYSFTYNGGSSAFRYVYLDDGAISCKATAATLTRKLPEICASLIATSALFNPGANAPAMRTARCIAALAHVRALEPSEVLQNPRKKKTKAELAIAAELKKTYDARQHACEDQKWSMGVISCLQRLQAVDNAKQCVPTW